MNLRKAQIVSALTWAFVMIVSAVIMRGAEQANTLILIQIGGATTHLLLLSNLATSINCKDEKVC